MSLHTSDLVLVPGQQLPPLETISGFQVRPGFFRFFGATVIPGGVNFTIQSHGATVCELLFFHKGEDDPFAILPFPDHYKIGFVYSMIVFGFDIEKYEYAYRLDGPYDEKRGLRFRCWKNPPGSLCQSSHRTESVGMCQSPISRIPRPCHAQ